MDEEYQRMAANSIAHEAFCAGQAWQQAAAAQERPCVLWKPSLFRDGNQWCALLGENIQDGVVGFGDSPDAAMWAFDEAWREKLPPAPGAQPAPSIPDTHNDMVVGLDYQGAMSCARQRAKKEAGLLYPEGDARKEEKERELASEYYRQYTTPNPGAKP